MIYKENSIIICNPSTKQNILEKSFLEKKLFNYTFITLNDFKERYYFKISDAAIVFAMNFLNCSYDNAKLITSNIYYVDDKEYSDEKLINLQNLKKELISHNLLTFDPYFIEFIKGKNIYVVNMFLDNFNAKMFESISNISNVSIINDNPKRGKYNIVEFDKHYDEVDYVFSEILKLLDNGTNINDIFIATESSEYDHMLFRYSRLYQIPVHISEKESIANHYIFKSYIDKLKQLRDKKMALEHIEKFNNSYIYNAIVKLLNRFYFIEDVPVLSEVLVSEALGVFYEDTVETDVVKVVKVSDGFKQNHHVFLIGFNNNSFPKMHNDDDYIGDKYSEILQITHTQDKNELERNKAIYYISTIDNLHISYARFTQGENVVSTIVDKLDYQIIEGKVNIGTSEKNDLIKLGIKLDSLINYNIHEAELDVLYATFDDVYKNYKNDLTELDKDLLKQKMKNYISLSYSSINKFYQCQFSYYLERVLKVRHDDDTKALAIGNIFHNILEKYGTVGFDLEEEKALQYSLIEDNSLKFYFNKLWPDFMLAIEFIEAFKEDTYLKEEIHEQEVKVDYSDSLCSRFFTGKIDKIMYQTIDGVDYIAIVDYKTGKTAATLDNIEYGLNLQLPVYAYFLAKTELFKNPKILGIYLHHIMKKPDTKVKKEIIEIKKDNLKLDGYTIFDIGDIKLIDPNFQSGKYIKNLSVTKSGNFNHYAKVFSDDDINRLIKTVEDLILSAFEKIEDGEFMINPKMIGGKDVSCTFCPYENICYKKYRDIKRLETMKFTEKVEE